MALGAGLITCTKMVVETHPRVELVRMAKEQAVITGVDNISC